MTDTLRSHGSITGPGAIDRHPAPVAASLRCGRFLLDPARPLVMGIVNLTPDSFSDGGRFDTVAAAVRHAHRLLDEGVDLLDFGAESTRPGALAVSVDEELARLLPVLAAMRDAPVPISIDTRKPAVMRRVLDVGASMINDVTGFVAAAARDAVAASDCGVCAMHMQGDPQTMQAAPRYDDVVGEVGRFLGGRLRALRDAGVADDRLVVDPGFGFGKSFDHNVALMRALPALASLGVPVLVGLSRKGFVGTMTGRPLADRLVGSVAAALMAVERGARIVRVHDVAPTVDALRVWSTVR